MDLFFNCDKVMLLLGVDFERDPDAKAIFENEIYGEAETEDYDLEGEETSLTGAVSTPKQPFNSMSDIASASYEARKVITL